MTEELQKKAEDFIIERYKIAECYREDNAETREYMRMDVHSQYEEEYQLYLDATKELQKENAELKKTYRKQRNKRIDELQKENKELKEKLKPENCLKLLAKEGYVKFTSEQLTKAKEWADKMYPCDGQAQRYLLMGAEFGYNKANEWHYVKDGDYPKDNKPVLCILGDIDSDSFEVGYYNDVGSGEPWHFESFLLPDDDGDNAWGVSAWKEIVLPELKESR